MSASDSQWVTNVFTLCESEPCFCLQGYHFSLTIFPFCLHDFAAHVERRRREIANHFGLSCIEQLPPARLSRACTALLDVCRIDGTIATIASRQCGARWRTLIAACAFQTRVLFQVPVQLAQNSVQGWLSHVKPIYQDPPSVLPQPVTVLFGYPPL